MAEPALDLPPEADAATRYARVHALSLAVLDGERDRVARMATVGCLLAAAFPDNLWTGFYQVDPEHPRQLVVGPYQGSLGCLRIDFGQGVCGTCAETGQVQVVADVNAFVGHIACDARSRSEIVVPVRDAAGILFAVLDVDSPLKGAFGETDAVALQALVDAVFAVSPGSRPGIG